MIPHEYAIHDAFHLRRFEPLPPEVSELVTPKIFPKGSIIMRQGDPALHFFYLHAGLVRGTIVRPDGTEKVLSFAEPSQFFAEGPFFQQSHYWYTGEVVETTQVSAFSREIMEDIIRIRPDFVFALMQSMAHKSWMLSNHMMSITFDPCEVRLARTLLEILARKPEGTRTLNITHQELSALVGTSRVMVTRILNGWRSRGIVDLRKGSLHIIDLPTLGSIRTYGTE